MKNIFCKELLIPQGLKQGHDTWNKDMPTTLFLEWPNYVHVYYLGFAGGYFFDALAHRSALLAEVFNPRSFTSCRWIELATSANNKNILLYNTMNLLLLFLSRLHARLAFHESSAAAAVQLRASLHHLVMENECGLLPHPNLVTSHIFLFHFLKVM